MKKEFSKGFRTFMENQWTIGIGSQVIGGLIVVLIAHLFGW